MDAPLVRPAILKIVAKAYCDDEYNANCDYALIEVDWESAQKIVDYCDFVRRMHAASSGSLFNASFQFPRAVFFCAPDDTWEEHHPGVLPVEVDWVPVSPEFNEARDTLWGPWLSDLVEAQRTDMNLMVVYNDGDVTWTSRPRNGGFDVTTAALPRTLFEDFIKL